MVFWTLLGMSNTVYQMQMMRKESWWGINLTSVHTTSLTMWSEQSGHFALSLPSKPLVFFAVKGFSPAAVALLSLFLLFPLNLWILYYYCWLLLDPLWLDPGKLNSMHFIELAVSKEAVKSYEFLVLSVGVLYVGLHSAMFFLSCFEYIFTTCCLLNSHSSCCRTLSKLCDVSRLQGKWCLCINGWGPYRFSRRNG